MPDAGNDQARRNAKELLLKEYDSLSESIWRNEATGETRVNWFIGIVTVGLGGLVKLVNDKPGLDRSIAIAGMLALLAFGVVTLCRIKLRNKRTDRMIASLDEIRTIFHLHFDPGNILAEYRPFGRQAGKPPARGFGGLADLVLTINSTIVGMTAVFYLGPGSHRLGSNVATSAAAFAVAFVIQYIFVRRDVKPTHAGGAVYRLGDKTAEYLLVGPKKDAPEKTEWLLPKGHIEQSDKGVKQAAVREVEEETGVKAVPIAALDTVSFHIQGRIVRVAFYLMRQTENGGGLGDGRRRAWFPFEEAIHNATHATTREVLRAAEMQRRSVEKRLSPSLGPYLEQNFDARGGN